jgi:hypothetical protein
MAVGPLQNSKNHVIISLCEVFSSDKTRVIIGSANFVALVTAKCSAFDTVNHSLLLATRAGRFSVSDTALYWFRFQPHRSFPIFLL